MNPDLFHIGVFTVYSYGFLIFLGMLVAFIFLKKEWKKIGLSSDVVNEIFLYAFTGILVGGKLFYFLERPTYFIRNPQLLFNSFGSGFVFYGSFLITIPVLYLFLKRRKLNFFEQFDLIAICGAIVHAFGKIGCLMAGCCYGQVCKKSWYSVLFTNPKSAAYPLNQDLYPTQIWDSITIFSIIAIMFFIKARKQFHGQLFLIYAILYAIERYFSENFRGDEIRGFLFNDFISHSQFIAIIILVFCISLYVYKLRTIKYKRIMDIL